MQNTIFERCLGFNIDCPQKTFILKVFNSNFPIEVADLKYRNNHSRVTKSLTISIKKRMTCIPSDCNNSNYMTFKNQLNSILRNKQRKYHSDQHELHRSNTLKS